MTELPSGTVTFLFTDIEGSTGLLKKLGREYDTVLEDHQRILRESFAAHGGREVDTQGDSFFVAFGSAGDAVASTAHAQQALARHPWPEDGEVRVRMGLHTGEPRPAGERYVGFGVHRAARIGAVGHGGQVLLSNATRELVEDELPPNVEIRDLGAFELKDLDRPERLYQLDVDGLPNTFPPLKARQVAEPRHVRRRTVLVALVPSLPQPQSRSRSWRKPADRTTGRRASTTEDTSSPWTRRRERSTGGSRRAERLQLSRRERVRCGWSMPTRARCSGSMRNRATPRPSPPAPPRRTSLLRPALSGSQTASGSRERSSSALWRRPSRASIRLRGPSAPSVSLPFEPGDVSNIVENRLAATDDALWAVTPDYKVVRIESATGAVTATSKAVPAIAVAAGGAGVWALGLDGRVVRLHERTGRPIARSRIPAPVTSIAVGDDAAWVTSSADGTLWRVSGGPNPGLGSITLAPGITDVAAGATAAWVVNPLAGTLSRVDMDTSTVTRTVELEGVPYAVAVDGETVWVANAPGPGGVATKNAAGIESLPARICEPVLAGADKPDMLLVSDLPLQGGIHITATQMAQAITFVLRERGFRAGKFAIAYQSCDDSIATSGLYDEAKCEANARAYAQNPQVVGVIGPLNSPCAVVAIPPLNRAPDGPLAMISPFNSFVGLTRSGPGVHPSLPASLYPTGKRNYVRVFPTDDLQGAALALFARDRDRAARVRPRRRRPRLRSAPCDGLRQGFAPARPDNRRSSELGSSRRRLFGNRRARRPLPGDSSVRGRPARHERCPRGTRPSCTIGAFRGHPRVRTG